VVAACEAVEYPLSISGPIINLGYATYEGYYNDTYDLNIWKRYARYFISFDMSVRLQFKSLSCCGVVSAVADLSTLPPQYPLCCTTDWTTSMAGARASSLR
jgi:hypothetical protein